MQSDDKEFKKQFQQRLIEFSLDIIKLCYNISRDGYLRIILNQLIRSATSIGANIAEAKSSSSKKDYLNYFQIALKSANETNYWLILLKESVKFQDNTKLNQTRDEIDRLMKELFEISNILASGILTMKGRK